MDLSGNEGFIKGLDNDVLSLVIHVSDAKLIDAEGFQHVSTNEVIIHADAIVEDKITFFVYGN